MLIKTNRLYLRLLTIDDTEALMPIFGDTDVMQYSRIGAMSIEQIRNSLINIHIKSYQDNGFGMYAIVQQADEQLIGIAGFLVQEVDGEKHIELAYRLAKKYWGHGLATEAVLGLKEYARATLNIQRLISIIVPSNIASSNVAQKIGMKFWKETKTHAILVHIYSINLQWLGTPKIKTKGFKFNREEANAR